MSDSSLVNASRPVVKEGDWVCLESRCSHINAQGRTTCEACGRTKPRAKGKVGHEIGKDAAEKSKGLFSADDWACSKCGNINWSRRSSCNICNAPKFGEVEARTGYGGGYMDRQEVEYVERAPSDEEYDEFGRKKKDKRNVRNDSSDEDVRKKVARNVQENRPETVAREDDEEDDEEEEEDDDGDLSKYVLDEDAVKDIEEKTKNGREAKNKADHSKRRSRSRSYSSSRTRSTSGSSYSSYSTIEDGSSGSSSSRSSSSPSRRRKSRSGSRHRRGGENSGGRLKRSRHSRSGSASSRSRSKKRYRRSK